MMQWASLNSAILQRVQLRSLERGVPALNALLVVLLAYTLAQLTWRVWPAAPQVEPPPRAVVQRVVQPQAGVQIADWHLFGVPPAEQEAGLPPETPLNFKLRGVFASELAQNAYAIIADAQGKEDGYRLGTELPGGVVLKEIFPDRVILTRSGRSETLSLPSERLSSAAPTGAGLIQPTSPRAADTVNTDSSPGALATGPPDNSALLRNYRDALNANPQSMLGLLTLELVQADGKQSGYRLLGGGDPELLGRFGLATGDVITAVNGITLNSAGKGAEVMKNLASANNLNLLIVRNGEQKSFSFQVGK